MKIAFVLTESAVISGNRNGIRSQALTWKKGLELSGNVVELINNWGNYDWQEYDAIHIFGYGKSIHVFINRLSQINKNIYLSPIIDSNQSPFLYRITALLGFKPLRIDSLGYVLKLAMRNTKGVFVRSDHEKRYVRYSLGVPSSKIYKVPLSYGLPMPENIEDIVEVKEPFCLHVSSIYQPRKNVIRLVKAAIKYDFELKLVGDAGSENEFAPIRQEIAQHKNIEVLGFVSKETLIDLYKRAKVFALPSINEGVGIVGLDAAVYGCNIVITKLGGPKEYYAKGAYVIDPLDIDQIGKAVTSAMSDDSKQPKLSGHISYQNSLSNTTTKLLKAYKS